MNDTAAHNPLRPLCIYLVGDSTIADERPSQGYVGWGAYFERLFVPGVTVRNFASCGRSSKSFIEEGKFDPVGKALKPGDYLFIQFGHNDSKPDAERRTEPQTTYKSFLSAYVETARGAGAEPVLVTSVNRRSFDEAGKLQPTHGAYPASVIELGISLDVPVVDLCALSFDYFESLGVERTKQIFFWMEPGQHPQYPEGASDNTHFNEYGAAQIASLVMLGMKRIGLPLAALFNERGADDAAEQRKL